MLLIPPVTTSSWCLPPSLLQESCSVICLLSRQKFFLWFPASINSCPFYAHLFLCQHCPLAWRSHLLCWPLPPVHVWKQGIIPQRAFRQDERAEPLWPYHQDPDMLMAINQTSSEKRSDGCGCGWPERVRSSNLKSYLWAISLHLLTFSDDKYRDCQWSTYSKYSVEAVLATGYWYRSLLRYPGRGCCFRPSVPYMRQTT